MGARHLRMLWRGFGASLVRFGLAAAWPRLSDRDGGVVVPPVQGTKTIRGVPKTAHNLACMVLAGLDDMGDIASAEAAAMLAKALSRGDGDPLHDAVLEQAKIANGTGWVQRGGAAAVAESEIGARGPAPLTKRVFIVCEEK